MEYETYENMSSNRPVTLLLKGMPGTGKTWKACQLPNPVLFSFDGNDRVLGKMDPAVRDAVRIIRPRVKNGKFLNSPQVWDHFTDSLAKVCEDDSVDTIIIDSLTTMANMLEDSILKNSSPKVTLEIQQWGEYSRYLSWLGDQFLLADDLDKNIVFTAHEKTIVKQVRGDDNKVRESITYKLLLSSFMKDAFDAYFSDVWRCYVKPMKQYAKYHVRTIPDDEFMAKCSLPIPRDFCWDDKKAEVIKYFERK